MQVKIISDNKVKGNRSVVLETLVKAFYHTDLLYELEEWSTWFSEEKISKDLHCCFDSTHHVNVEGRPSLSISRFWRLYGLQAERADTHESLGMPASHLWYEAIRNDLA